MARILIVDGDPASREPLERAIAREGLDVVVAADPEAAWEAAVAFTPRAVVLGRGLDRAGAESLIVRLRRAHPDVLFLSPSPPWADMARTLRVRLGAPAPRDLPAPEAPPPGTARVLARPPLESGPLTFGALPDLLARLWRSAADGIVSIDGPRGADRILVLRGAVVAVRLADAAGAADPEEALAELCAGAEGHFAFHPGSDFAPEVRADRIPALAPLLEGLRRGADETSFAEALGPGEAAAPRRTGASAAVLRELALGADDAATATAVDGTTPVATLLRGRGRPASLVWFLLRCGAAEVPPAARQAGATPRLAATAPHAPA